MNDKCKCTQGYCCDSCWRLVAKVDPCKIKNCKNPRGHSGNHGIFNNTGVIVITEEEIINYVIGGE